MDITNESKFFPLNVIDFKVKSTFFIVIDEILTPFNIFQVF